MVDSIFIKIMVLSPYGRDYMNTKDSLLMEMGNHLRQQRKQMKLTQEELAERSELSIKTIISAEKGQKALRPENIVRLCQSLDMDISYLMTGQISSSKDIFLLSHQERMALDKMINTFLSICDQDKER